MPTDRFYEKVMFEPNSGCWLWTAGCGTAGYGTFWVGQPLNRTVSAYRWAYEHLVGPIPEGLTLDHLCRIRHCVNPWHLEPVTHRENVLRGVAPSARNAVKTDCPRGHPYDEENTYWRPNGMGRDCRICGSQRTREWRARGLQTRSAS